MGVAWCMVVVVGVAWWMAPALPCAVTVSPDSALLP